MRAVFKFAPRFAGNFMYCCILICEYYVHVLGKMPCWYFDRSELENTPSSRSGVDAVTEKKYRREGAKLIVDAGSALGLYPVIFISCLHVTFLF